jgi:TonB family protein
MNDVYSVLADFGHQAWLWFWLPIALWSAVAIAIIAAARFIRPAVALRPMIQQLVLALPIGITANAGLALFGQSAATDLLTLPNLVATTAASNTAETQLDFLQVFWFVTGCATIAVCLVALVELTKLARKTTATRHALTLFRRSTDIAASGCAQSLSNFLGGRSRVDVCYSNLTSVPFAAGWRQPVVVLPRSFRDPSSVELALIHELSHIRRGHAFSRWFLFATRAVFWFHPLVSVAIERVLTLQECECDHDVLAVGSSGRREYANLLFNFSTEASPAPVVPGSPGLLCTTIYSHPQQLKHRIMAMQSPFKISAGRNRVLSGLTLLLVVSLIACSDVASPTATATTEVEMSEAAATIDGDALTAEGIDSWPSLQSSYNDLKYPAIAKKAGIEGRVVIQFVVDTDGSVSSATVLRGIGGGCDEEALRFVKASKWTPGMGDGKPVKVKLSIPITFKLPDTDA